MPESIVKMTTDGPIRLPSNFHAPNTLWAQMVTLRCDAGCPYCILNGRGRCQDSTPQSQELSGAEIVRFWNRIERSGPRALSIIGGEPTLHPDIAEIIGGLEGYAITMTTKCKSPFYSEQDFTALLKPHPSSTLRINTTFHPHHCTPEEYLDVVAKFKEAGFAVDQVGYVNHPDVERYRDRLDAVAAVQGESKGAREAGKLKGAPFLGFWDEERHFRAAFDPELLWPNEQYAFPEDSKRMCGIGDYQAFAHQCGQYHKSEVTCPHPLRSIIIGPDGHLYKCHYQMYYQIDPISHVHAFKAATGEDTNCRHYGFCNWCDVPRTGNIENRTAVRVPLNLTLYRQDMYRREIARVLLEMARVSGEDAMLGVSHGVAWSYLYSGHVHRGQTLIVGKDAAVIEAFLKGRGYTIRFAGEELGEYEPNPNGLDWLLLLDRSPSHMQSFQRLAVALKPGGVMSVVNSSRAAIETMIRRGEFVGLPIVGEFPELAHTGWHVATFRKPV